VLRVGELSQPKSVSLALFTAFRAHTSTVGEKRKESDVLIPSLRNSFKEGSRKTIGWWNNRGSIQRRGLAKGAGDLKEW